MIRHGATALARQSGRCHHPHIPVRRRRACSSSGPCCCRAQPRRPLYFESGIYNGSGTLCGLWRSPALRRLLNLPAQARVSVEGGGVAPQPPARPDAAPARATARTRVCATPSREMCGANIGSRLLQRAGSSNHGTHSAVKRLSHHVVGLISAHATRYALRVRTHREIHTLRSLSGGR